MALRRAKQITAEAVQIFVKSNMRWFGNSPSPEDVARFARELARQDFACVFGHTGYLINLGAPASKNRDLSIQSLVQEIQFAASLRLPFLVMHPGAHLGAGEPGGLKQIVAGLDEAFAVTQKSAVRIALENTAGQGSCLDTAHFFAAGYDLSRPQGWDAAMREVDSLIGLKQVLAFHLNDSKTDLGSRVDRHAHIGAGKIGLRGFRHIVNDARFQSHPGCLETPKNKDLKEDVQNLATLRKLASKL